MVYRFFVVRISAPHEKRRNALEMAVSIKKARAGRWPIRDDRGNDPWAQVLDGANEATEADSSRV